MEKLKKKIYWLLHGIWWNTKYYLKEVKSMKREDVEAGVMAFIFVVVMFGVLWIVIWGVHNSPEHEGVLSLGKDKGDFSEYKTAPVEEEVRKQLFKPVYAIANNKLKWAGDGFANILRNECNKCKEVCWNTEGDPGGMTCLGFATRDNSDLFIKILNRAWLVCQDQRIYTPIGGDTPFGVVKNFCYFMRLEYWKRYVEKYSKCYYSAMMHLSDTAILQGHKATAKILQRSAGLKVDGIFGPKSRTFCQDGLWDKEGFIAERLKYLKSLKGWDKFGDGWEKRVNRMAKKY